MIHRKMLIRIVCFCLTVVCSVLSPETLYGIVTSFETGSHVVTPGETMFDVNLDGVALVAGDVPDSQAISELIPFCSSTV